MESKKNKRRRGSKAFSTIYSIGIGFSVVKLVDYLQWTFQLIEKWEIPSDPFFSKVNLTQSNAEISEMAYLIFALAYILMFGFIIRGLYRLNSVSKLMETENIFDTKVSSSFIKAGQSFLIFAFGTLIIDTVFLLWAHTSNKLIALLSTELIIFVIFGYFMFFLAHVFNKGVVLQEENNLTI